MDRRSFIKNTAATGAVAFFGTTFAGCRILAGKAEKAADISVVNGASYFENTRKAVDVLGGMDRFVPKGSRVGVLINSGFDTKGAYVNPDVSLSTIKMCLDAGAEEVVCLQVVEEKYWERSGYYEDLKPEFEKVSQVGSNLFPAEFNDEDWKKIPKIDHSVSLEEVEVIKALEEVDVLINIFIAKHHASTFYTGALKNSMGYCTRKTNVFYHLGSGERNNPDFLAQCIVDINRLRQPDLIIGDATEFIVTNGPSGPGDMIQLDKVFAGTNLVAMDALGVSYNDLLPEDIPTLVKAQQAGLGKYNIEDLNIVELS